MEFTAIMKTIIVLLVVFIEVSTATESKCQSTSGWEEIDENKFKMVTCKSGKCFGSTANGKKGEKVGKFGCSMNETDLELVAPELIKRIQENPREIQFKMSMNHAGLSMNAEIRADKKLVSRIVSAVESGSLEKLGGSYEVDVYNLGEDLVKIVLDNEPNNVEEAIEGVITPAMEKIQEFTLDEELEVKFNTEFSLKPQKGGELSIKVGLNGKTTPKKVANIKSSNEAAMQLCIGEDCVLMGMCSENDCNKQAKFAKLANSSSDAERISIGFLMLLTLLFIQQQKIF